MDLQPRAAADEAVGTSTEGAAAVLVIAPGGAILLAEGAAIAALAPDAVRSGATAAAALAELPELVRAIEGATQGRSSSTRVRARGRSLKVHVEPRRGGGALVIATDVSGRARGDRARQAVERELRLLFRQAPGAVWTTDRDLVLSSAFGRLPAELELEAPAVLGHTVASVLHATEDDVLVAAHRAALAGERRSYPYAYRGRRFDVTTDPLRSEHGDITGTISAAVDVTRSIDAEERLARSQAMLADAQRLAHVGSWEWDVARDLVTWSDEMYRIYGLSPDAFVPTFAGFLSRIPPDDAARTKDVIFGAFQRPGPFVYDHRVARPDGSIRMLHTRGDVIVDARGRATRMLGTCWDVTDRWETATALERTASLLQATLEATVDGILVVDAAGERITAHNRRFAEMWSVPRELVEDGDDAALVAYVAPQLQDPTAFVAGVRELYAHPEKEALDVIRFRDGRIFERSSRPQRLAGRVVGRVWSFRDITERERLLRRAEFLSDAARLLSSLDVEPALASVAQLSVPFLGDSCAFDLLGDGAPRRLLAVSRDHTRPPAPELSPTTLEGRASIYTVGATAHMAVPLIVSGRVTGAITFAAAPGRRYAQSELEIAQELARRAALAIERSLLLSRAQEALRAREEFLAVAAHEIRGPVTSMHAAVQALLRRKLGETAASRALEIIQREDRRLARFVDELLDLALTHGPGIGPAELEPVSLARVVRDVVARHEDELVRSGSSLAIELDEQAIGTWNRERLEKAVATLLSNAIKFGLGRPIEIAVRARGGRATIRVLDHGIGIPKDAQARIFQPFERAVSVRHYGGLGLGLYIAQSIVLGLGGTITCESEPGVGSVFTIELPQGGPR